MEVLKKGDGDERISRQRVGGSGHDIENSGVTLGQNFEAGALSSSRGGQGRVSDNYDINNCSNGNESCYSTETAYRPFSQDQ
jgi:hypothetical protein